MPVLATSLWTLVITHLKELTPQLTQVISGGLRILKESEISSGLDKYVLQCKYKFIIGPPNNLEVRIFPSPANLFWKTFFKDDSK